MSKTEIVIDVTDTIKQIAVANIIGGIQKVVFSICGRLGQSAKLVYIDFETGQCFPVSHYELDFYRIKRDLSILLGPGIDPDTVLLSYFKDREPLQIKPGSIVIFPGGPWNYMPQATDFIRDLASKCRVTCIVHDLLPIFAPETMPTPQSHFVNFYRNLADSKDIRWMTGVDVVESDLQRLAVAGPVEKVPFGTEFDIFRPAQNQNESLLGLREQNFALMVGAADGRKRHDLFIDAWVESGIYHHMKLCIAAYATEDDERFRRSYAAAREVTENVFLLQNMYDDELATALEACKFVIYPSEKEGWGLPVGEAAYFRKYCLVFGNGFSHHENAVVVKEKDIRMLAQDGFQDILKMEKYPGSKYSWHRFIEALIR